MRACWLKRPSMPPRLRGATVSLVEWRIAHAHLVFWKRKHGAGDGTANEDLFYRLLYTQRVCCRQRLLDDMLMRFLGAH